VDFQEDIYTGLVTSKCWLALLYNCELQNLRKYKSCVTLKNFENMRTETFNSVVLHPSALKWNF
jgi:hypothetical protein